MYLVWSCLDSVRPWQTWLRVHGNANRGRHWNWFVVVLWYILCIYIAFLLYPFSILDMLSLTSCVIIVSTDHRDAFNSLRLDERLGFFSCFYYERYLATHDPGWALYTYSYINIYIKFCQIFLNICFCNLFYNIDTVI